MQIDNINESKNSSVIVDDILRFGTELYENDNELLSRYSFALQDRILTENEAKSFLSFVRKQLSSK